MLRNVLILGLLIAIVALPFIFRQTPAVGDWRPGDPQIVVISPHNEAIRYEFERAFSHWHAKKYGKPVKIDWRNIGGTTEIARYLDSEYATRSRPWLERSFPGLPRGANEDLVKPARPADPQVAAAWDAFRSTDDPAQFTISVDVFFGGGWFDHDSARRKGELAAPFVKGQEPASLKDVIAGPMPLIPTELAGEMWRNDYVFGAAISAFGIVYNIDRLKQLGVDEKDWPERWADLADPVYFGQVGVTDPTKSGSIAKAFELIVHQQMHDRVVRDLKLTDAQIAANEKAIAAWVAATTKERGKPPARWEVPEQLKAYQASLEAGWVDGMRLIQQIGANSRYFTDSATKVSIDVSMGDAAVGMSIDFYGRYQAQTMKSADGVERMRYVNPIGGTSASCDPISLLRGAEHREIATHFIEFVLSPEGQQIWTYPPGAKGGPEKYALRRIPIRRDFFPSTQPALQAEHVKHARVAVIDKLADPAIDPYQIGQHFQYYARWTGDHFGVQRELVRAMCLDSGDELRDAWRTIHRKGIDPATSARAIEAMSVMPTIKIQDKTGKWTDQPLSWRNAPDIRRNFEAMDYMRLWTAAFREQYRTAREVASQ